LFQYEPFQHISTMKKKNQCSWTYEKLQVAKEN